MRRVCVCVCVCVCVVQLWVERPQEPAQDSVRWLGRRLRR